MRCLERLVALGFVYFPRIARLWFRGGRGLRGVPPFVPLRRPLEELRFGLVTTGGVHHIDQPAFRRRKESLEGDASYRELDLQRERASLRITHDWYDHSDAERDLNLVLPYERLCELAREHVIGSVHPRAIGLMGHVEGAQEARLERETAPAIADFFEHQGVDTVLLVPA